MNDPSSTKGNNQAQQSLPTGLNTDSIISDLRKYVSNLNELQGDVTNLNCIFDEMSQGKNSEANNSQILEFTQKNLNISKKYIEFYSILAKLTDELESNLSNSNKDFIQLNERYQISLDQIQQLKNTIDERDIQIGQLRDLLSNASDEQQKEIDKLKAEVASKENTINNLNTKMSSLKESQEETISKQKRKILELEFAQRKLKGENDKIKKQIEKSQSSMEEMIKIRVSQTSGAEIEKVKRELKAKDTRIDTLEGELNQKNDMVQQLQEKIILLDEKDQKIRELEDKCKSASAQDTKMSNDPRLEQKIKELELKLKQQSDYESLKSKMHQQEQKIKQLETEKSKMIDMAQLLDLKKTHQSEISLRTNQVKELERIVSQLKGKNENLSKELQSRSMQIDELNETIDDLRIKNVELHESQSSDLLTLNEEIKIKENEIDVQGQQIAELQNELAQYRIHKDKLTSTEQRNIILSNVCCRLFNKQSVDFLTENEMNSYVDLLQNKINEKSNEINKLKQELQAERESSSRMKNLVRTFHNGEAETAMVYTFDNYQIQLRKFEEIQKNQKQEIQNQKDKINQLEQEKGELENKLKQHQKEIFDMKNQISKLLQQISSKVEPRTKVATVNNDQINTRSIKSNFANGNNRSPELNSAKSNESTKMNSPSQNNESPQMNSHKENNQNSPKMSSLKENYKDSLTKLDLPKENDHNSPNKNNELDDNFRTRRFSFSNNPRFDKFMSCSPTAHVSKTPKAKKRTVSFNQPELFGISASDLEQAADSSNDKAGTSSTDQSRSLPSSEMKQTTTIEFEEDESIQLLDKILSHFEFVFNCPTSQNDEKERIRNLKKMIAGKIREYKGQMNNKNIVIVGLADDSNENQKAGNQKKVNALKSIVEGLDLVSYNRHSAIEKLVKLTGSPETDEVFQSLNLNSSNKDEIIFSLFTGIFNKLNEIFHLDIKENLCEIKDNNSAYFMGVKYAALLTKLQQLQQNYEANDAKNNLRISNLQKKYKKAKHFMLGTKMNDKGTIDSLISFCPPIGEIDRVKKRTATLPDVVSLFLSEFPSYVIKKVNQAYSGKMEEMIQKINNLAEKVNIVHSKMQAEVEKSHGINYVTKHQMFQTFSTTLNTLFPASLEATPCISEVRLNGLLNKVTRLLQIALRLVSNTNVKKDDSIYDYAFALRKYLTASTLGSNAGLLDTDEVSISCLQ